MPTGRFTVRFARDPEEHELLAEQDGGRQPAGERRVASVRAPCSGVGSTGQVTSSAPEGFGIR